MNKALMIDCESLDIAPTAALLTVGIVEMDLDALTLGSEFHIRIDADDCMKHGMTVSADTLRWWVEQQPEALRAAFYRNDKRADLDQNDDYWHPLCLALPKIELYVKSSGAKEFWSCGGRDFEWLETAYKALSLPAPWAYNQWRDYRTMRHMFRNVASPPDTGKRHDALVDAKWQAEHLLAIMRHIRTMSAPVVEEEGL